MPSGRVVACMATFPPRKEIAAQALASLVDQVDHLYVYLNQYDTVPMEFQHPKVSAVLASEAVGDLRDLGKFYFIDELRDDTVLLVDDDILYPQDYATTLVGSLRHVAVPAVVGVHGRILREGFADYFTHSRVIHFQQPLAGDMLVDVLGTGTVAFVPERIGLTFDMVAAKGMADIDMAIIARSRGVPMVAVAHRGMWMRDLSAVSGNSDNSLYEEFRLQGEELATLLKAGAMWGIAGLAELVEHAFPESVPMPLQTVLATVLSCDVQGAGLWRAMHAKPAPNPGTCASNLVVRALRGQLTPRELASMTGVDLNGQEASYLIDRLQHRLDTSGAWDVWQAAIDGPRMDRFGRVLVGRALLGNTAMSGDDVVALFHAVAEQLPAPESQAAPMVALRFARITSRQALSRARALTRAVLNRVPKSLRQRTRVLTRAAGSGIADRFANVPRPNDREYLVAGLPLGSLDVNAASALWSVVKPHARLRATEKVTIGLALANIEGSQHRFIDCARMVADLRRPAITTLLTLQEFSIVLANRARWDASAQQEARQEMLVIAKRSLRRGAGRPATLTAARTLQNIDPRAALTLVHDTQWPEDLTTESMMLAGAESTLDSLNVLWRELGLDEVSDCPALRWRTAGPVEPITIPQRDAHPEPQVAVVVAAYNAENTVVGAVESVLRQTLDALEVFCVDDGSTDGTLGALQALAERDGRVMVLRAPVPLGPYGVRNLVLGRTHAPYIAIADADDWSHPQRLERELAALQSSDALAVFAQHIRIAEGHFIDENSGRLFGDGLSSAIFDARVFRTLGSFLPTRTRGDVEYRARIRKLAGKSAIAVVPTPFVLARHNLGSNSHRFDKLELAEFRRRWQAFHEQAARHTGAMDTYMAEAQRTTFHGLVPASMRIQ